MFRPRVIPVLLLKDNVLVKSTRFKQHRYIGDPINAVRIFSNLKADELIILDISASANGTTIASSLIREIGEETNMPFAVGGGIKTIDNIREAMAAGAEKVVICSKAGENPAFIEEAANTFGSSSISVCMDVKKNFFGKEYVYTRSGKKPIAYSPVDFAQLMEKSGAGEIIVQSIERDGTMFGYDEQLIKRIALSTTIPVIALGGAGTYNHMKETFSNGHATGLAGGSIFIYQGKRKGVLINYPSHKEIEFTTCNEPINNVSDA